MIRTLIFDLSEVIIAGLFGLEKILAPQVGMQEREVMRFFGGDLLQAAICCGQISEKEYLSQLLARSGWPLSQQYLKNLIRANFHTEVPGMRPLLERLSELYELALLSDHAREWAAYLRSVHSVFDLFQVVFFSYELGQTKRSPETFRQVSQKLDRQPGECLFIDDNSENVARAESVGMTGITFISAEDLETQLKLRGML